MFSSILHLLPRAGLWYRAEQLADGQQPPVHHAGAARGLALSADGQLLASGGLDGTVRLWDPRFAGQA